VSAAGLAFRKTTVPPTASSSLLFADAVTTAQLDNGLTVLVLADPSVPNLAYETTYRVGSRNERPGITGISHLFEHMMFNGARRHGPKAFDRMIESNGGVSNAYTTHDITTYYEVMPADKLGVILDLESDRMRDLDLTERNLASEREVVKEERRVRTEESPIGLLYEQLYATAFVAHPYRWPVVGWMADLDAISVADVHDYFRMHYAPNNAVVAIAGAVDPARAVERVAEALGPLPRGPQRPAVVRSEPRQRGERRVTVRKEAQLPIVLAAWHVGDAASPDVATLDVLQTLLVDGDSSRLRRRLVLQDRLVVDVHVYYQWMLDPGLFIIGATLAPDVEPARYEAALDEELRITADAPTAEHALRTAKNQLQSDFYRRLKTNEGRADLLGAHEVLLGSYWQVFELPGRYEAVTGEDVRRVAADTFRVDNRTVALLDPLDEDASHG
jgi:predicted Zn-dependent peptidase